MASDKCDGLVDGFSALKLLTGLIPSRFVTCAHAIQNSRGPDLCLPHTSATESITLFTCPPQILMCIAWGLAERWVLIAFVPSVSPLFRMQGGANAATRCYGKAYLVRVNALASSIRSVLRMEKGVPFANSVARCIDDD